jgi:hypothetical protein
MRNIFGWSSICFAGGLFGGLVNSIFIWMAGAYGWTAAIDVALAPAWTLPWLYPRLVWGGLWGLLFMPRLLADSVFWRGLVLSLPPTLVQLLIVFPNQLEKGFWGLDLGNLTPVVVIVANAVWGWAAALWVLLADDERHAYGRRLR